MPYAAIAAIAASLIGSLIGAGQDAEAAALRKKMLDQYGPEMLPHLDKAIAEQTGSSTLAQMPEDDSLRRRQMDTLSELENVYRTGGNTAADKAALQLANDTVASQAGARAAEYGDAMRQRGLQNSGLAAALNVQGQQTATNALAGMARQNQSDARSRALQALEAGAGLAGNVRGQDFQRAEAIAQAQDRINMFNAGQRTDANMYNLSLPQRNFDNQMLLNNARSAAANGVAAGYERGAQSARDTGAGVGNAALTYGMWGESKKKES